MIFSPSAALNSSCAKLTGDECLSLCFCQLSDQREKLSLQVQQLSLDCKMHQQKATVVQNQMRELQAERDQVENCFLLLFLQKAPTSMLPCCFTVTITSSSFVL